MDRQICIEIVRAELAQAITMGMQQNLWEIHVDEQDPLKFTVTIPNRSIGEEFVLEFVCDEYKLKPPHIEMIDPRNGQRGVKSAYPQGDSLFHGHPVICHPCNRKAYAGYSGVHGEWTYTNWVASAKAASTLGDMIIMIYSRIQKCTGRMA